MITVVGLGFVGLTTALGFSHKGYKVYGLDTDENKLNTLKAGKIPFYEPNLEEILGENLNKNFIIPDSAEECIKNSKIIFFCVGTPNDENGNSDLSCLFEAIKDILSKIGKEDSKILIIKSTVPPSTAKEKILPFIDNSGYSNIKLLNNPEFLREGHAWDDFINPDRIVIGYQDEASVGVLEELYKPFGAPVFKVSLNTAEFIKYFSNTFLSNLISFSNEMSMIASSIGDIDIPSSFKINHLDKRWSGNPAPMTSYLYPGCGFGGYCLPKDVQALYSESVNKGYVPAIVKNILEVNKKIKEFAVGKVLANIGKEECIGILGLSFKPESDDVRETPSKDIIKMLLGKGYSKIIVYDPLANQNFRDAYNLPIEYAENLEEIFSSCDNIIVLIAWDEFKKYKRQLAGKNVLDFRYYL